MTEHDIRLKSREKSKKVVNCAPFSIDNVRSQIHTELLNNLSTVEEADQERETVHLERRTGDHVQLTENQNRKSTSHGILQPGRHNTSRTMSHPVTRTS